MAIPSINDLIKYTTSKLTGAAWNSNFSKIVNWITDGTADINVKTLTTSGSQTIGGAQNVLGDLTVNGTTTSAGNITTNGYFVGDGSLISNLSTNISKNWLINGGCILKDNADYTLVNNTYGTSVNRFFGMASGTAVSAGTFTQNTSSSIGQTGYSIKFSACTITGTGLIYLRSRIESKNAKMLKNNNLSFGCLCYQDTGSPLNYTVYARKANSVDDFTTTTNISNSGAIGVASSASVSLKYENFAVGDCSNGLEIEIKVECGAITTKNFEFTQLQLEINATASAFNNELINNTKFIDSYTASTNNFTLPYYQRIYSNVITGSPVSSINITGLDGNTDSDYYMKCFFKMSANCSVRLQMNGDTSANYLEGGVSVSNINLATVSATYSVISAYISSKTSSVKTICGARMISSASTGTFGGWWTNTTDNLTTLNITQSASATFNAGTIIELYARR